MNGAGVASLSVRSNPAWRSAPVPPAHPSVMRSPADLPSIELPSTVTPTGTDIHTIEALRADAICTFTVRVPAVVVESSSTFSSGGGAFIGGASPSVVLPRFKYAKSREMLARLPSGVSRVASPASFGSHPPRT